MNGSGEESKPTVDPLILGREGRWDPTLDAYVVEIDGKQCYYVWKRPWMELEALGMTVITLFWVGVATLLLSTIFTYPQGVAGDRQAQLAEALEDKYAVKVDYLPKNWSQTQVFTVDIEQGWDDPAYDEPRIETEGCRLQPGATHEDLSLQCPGALVRTFTEVREGGRSAHQDREYKKRLEKLRQPPPGGRESGSFEDQRSDPRDDYEPPDDFLYDPLDDYEPEIYP